MRCPLAGTGSGGEYGAKVVLKRAGREEAVRREERMHAFLKGLRVVEGSAFVAAPLAGLTLLQMGAEVIRFDTIGGGPDYTRWPRAGGDEGRSLYWEGFNKGKKSVALDLRSPEGRELAQALVTAPGEGAGLFVTNFPARGFPSHDILAERRPDLISARVMGWRDGRNAVDYTVNAALGYPMMTSAPGEHGPVNHVMPARDVATGLYAAMALVSAERARSRTGKGTELRVPLGDVARATLGNLGQIAEVMLTGADRPRLGNDIFGAHPAAMDRPGARAGPRPGRGASGGRDRRVARRRRGAAFPPPRQAEPAHRPRPLAALPPRIPRPGGGHRPLLGALPDAGGGDA